MGRQFYLVSPSQFTSAMQDKFPDMSVPSILSFYDSIIDGDKLPQRATLCSSGYDFFAHMPFTLKPGEMIKYPTGIKAAMEKSNVLLMVVRSSVGFKYNVRLMNQVGVIDSDYYNNVDNEGHIFVAFMNEGTKDWVVKQGDAIAQGLFVNYLITEDDYPATKTRDGGLGSTSKKTS